MTKTFLVVATAASAIATLASAEPATSWATRADLAAMNLTPTGVATRDVPTRHFAPDKTPTVFHYDLPEPGMGAVVGYKPYVDTHPIQAYEVNEATAVGFSQPSSSVGAALAYKF